MFQFFFFFFSIDSVIEGPSNLEITNVDSTSISFRWVEATGQRDGYLVSASYSNINNSIVAAIDGNSHTFDNLPPYTTIDISVQTVFVQDGIEIRSNPLTRSQRTSGDSKFVNEYFSSKRVKNKKHNGRNVNEAYWTKLQPHGLYLFWENSEWNLSFFYWFFCIFVFVVLFVLAKSTDTDRVNWISDLWH